MPVPVFSYMEAAMAAISGKYGEVVLDTCNILELESWTLTYGSQVQPYFSRAGGGFQKTVDGAHAGNGSVTGFVDTDNPLTATIVTGTVYSASFRHTATGPVAWTGNIRVGQVTTGANRDGTIQPVSFDFMTDGEITEPA